MIHRIRFIAAAGFSLLLAQPALAQWIDYKTPGLPRGGDGKVNMTAPRPMTADGKPDFTGLWLLRPAKDVSGALDQAGPQPWIVDAAKTFMHELGRDDTGVHCLPSGPRMILDGDGSYVKVVQTPALVTVLYESLAFRQIFTDGRPLPTDPNPSWFGYSVGTWEGDALVVTSAGFNDRTFLDGMGHRHSEALRVTERYRRRDLGHMDLEVTLEDSKAYASPVTIPVEATLVPDTDFIEYICNENERSRIHLVGTADDDKKLQVKVAPAILARYAGTFRFPPFMPGDKPLLVIVAPKDDGLALSIEAGPTMTVIPTSETKFLGQGVGVQFFPGPNGVVNEMSFTIVEGEFKGTRVK